jgi:hypothetical protein
LDTFERTANEQLAAYTEEEEKRRKEPLETAEVPDEEGFITVVPKKAKVFEGEQEAEMGTSGVSAKNTTKVFPNFYKLEGVAKQREKMNRMVLQSTSKSESLIICVPRDE